MGMSYSSASDTGSTSQASVLDQLDGSLLIRILRNVRETRTRAQLACVCKGWRTAVCDSWDSVRLTFTKKEELEAQLSWLSVQLHERPWLLQAIELCCGKYMDPVSLDLHLARFSGLTSLNLLRVSHFGHTEEDFEQGLHQIWRQNFTLRPEALEKLLCTSASLQKLWVAFTEDTEHLTLQMFSGFTNLQDLHVVLCGYIGDAFVPSHVKLSASLTALRKLKALTVRNGNTIKEEEPGVLATLSGHLTRMHLHCRGLECEHICSPTLQSLRLLCPDTHRPPVGYCPELHTLCHSARDVTAEDLLQLPKLTTLRDMIWAPTNMTSGFVMGLQPLSCLQQIHLSQYHAGAHGTLQEMSLFPKLQSLSIMVDDDPSHLNFSADLSRLSALHTIDVRKSFTATHYAPVVSAEADFLTSLRSLTLECKKVDPMRSPSVEFLEIFGPGGYMVSDWPEVKGCPMLTVLKLHNMPPNIPRWLMAQLKTLTLLRQLQLTISYVLRPCTHVAFKPGSQTHSLLVDELLNTALGLPALQALQLDALRADVVLDPGKARSEELSHLALACRAFRMLFPEGQSASQKEAFQSVHVLARECPDAATLQYLEAREPSKRLNEEFGAYAYKIGPPHALDLDWDEVFEDVREEWGSVNFEENEVLIDI